MFCFAAFFCWQHSSPCFLFSNDCYFLSAYPWTNALNPNLVHWLYLTDVKLPPDPKLLFSKLLEIQRPDLTFLNPSEGKLLARQAYHTCHDINLSWIVFVS